MKCRCADCGRCMEHRCDDCGKVGEDVKQTTCPYQYEVNEDIVTAFLCRDCYEERCDDI